MKLKTLIKQLTKIEEQYRNLDVLRLGHINEVGFTSVNTHKAKVICPSTKPYIVIE